MLKNKNVTGKKQNSRWKTHPVLMELKLVDDYKNGSLVAKIKFQTVRSHNIFDWICVTFCMWLQIDHHKKTEAWGSPEGSVNTWN